MRASHTQRGFTLVEMIVVIVVMAAIFAVGGAALGRAFESYVLTETVTDVDWQGRVALERMLRELREIRSATAADLDLASSTQIWFVDASGNGVCFYRDGATSRLMRSSAATSATCTTATAQPLADNVAAGGLSFAYYDNTGTATVAATQVRYIAITLNVINAQINETYRASLTPRRF